MLMSLVATVAPRTGKIKKKVLNYFEREESLLHFYIYVKTIVRDYVGKLEFKQTRNRLSVVLKGLTILSI